MKSSLDLEDTKKIFKKNKLPIKLKAPPLLNEGAKKNIIQTN
tara:strand:+ start:296 stop:421 length:126 start_codon:yes stop_codon:yes gene_type:complete